MQIKHYDDLTTDELYAILNLRCQVFIVEQNCPYLDVDNLDQKCYHVLHFDEKGLGLYGRIIKPGVLFEEASFGRVIVRQDLRKQNFGRLLVRQMVDFCDKYRYEKIKISAQAHLVKFYEGFNFISQGDPYYEDNILHIEMIRGK